MRSDVDSLIVGGIRTARLTRTALAALMVEDCLRARRGELQRPKIVVSSNGAVIAAYHHDPVFRASIAAADIVDADGMPLVFASRLRCKTPLRERVATTDFVHDAAAAAEIHGLRFFFLGARPGVAAKAAEQIRRVHPGLELAGVRHGYFSPEEEADICADIRARHTDVLWVGLGSPQQEAFAVRNRERLAGLGWIRTCGGLFDHHAGTTRRAPLWLQTMGLEWLHRAVQEPNRLALRYIRTNPAALYHLVTKTHD